MHFLTEILHFERLLKREIERILGEDKAVWIINWSVHLYVNYVKAHVF